MNQHIRQTIALFALLVGCTADVAPEPATELVLRMECEEPICTRSARLRIRAARVLDDLGHAEPAKTVSLTLGASSSWPIDIPIIPHDPRQLPQGVQLSVESFDRASGLLSDVRALTGFVRGSQRMLRVRLERCGERPLGSSCEPDPSCEGTHCHSCDNAQCAQLTFTDPHSLPALDATATEARNSKSSERALPVAADVSDRTSGSARTDAGTESAGTATAGNPAPKPQSKATNPPQTGGMPAAAGSGGSNATSAAPRNPEAPATSNEHALAPLSWAAPQPLEEDQASVLQPTFAHNRTGGIAVAWWQAATGGYLWVRRYRDGGWDPAPLPAGGLPLPTDIWGPPYLGIDGSGSAQLLSLMDSATPAGVLRRAEWARWRDDNSFDLESPWLAGKAAAGIVPAALDVTDDGFASAMFIAPADATNGMAQVYLTTFDKMAWAMPSSVGAIRYANTDFPDNASNGLGVHASLFRVSHSPNDAATHELYALVAQAGTLLSTSTVTLPEPLYDSVQIAIDDHGDAMALLALGPTANRHLYTTRYRASSKQWSPPAQLTANTPKAFALTLTQTGQPIAVWREVSSDKSQTTLMLARYTDGDNWSAPKPIGSAQSADETDDTDGLLVTASTSDELLMAWTQRGGPDTQTAGRAILACRANSATDNCAAPSMLTQHTDALALMGAVWDSSSRAVVVWQQTDSDGTRQSLQWTSSQ